MKHYLIIALILLIGCKSKPETKRTDGNYKSHLQGGERVGYDPANTEIDRPRYFFVSYLVMDGQRASYGNSSFSGYNFPVEDSLVTKIWKDMKCEGNRYPIKRLTILSICEFKSDSDFWLWIGKRDSIKSKPCK